MTDAYFKPRTAEEIVGATPGADYYVYVDLCKDRRHAADILLSLPEKSFILISSPTDKHKGHWVAISRDTTNRKIFYFDSYGYGPDRAKMKWLTPQQLRQSGQMRNLFNDGLKELCRRGWEVHYNDVKYQVEGDLSATCGIWASAFLNSEVNPDVFAAHPPDLRNYYRVYFRKE